MICAVARRFLLSGICRLHRAGHPDSEGKENSHELEARKDKKEKGAECVSEGRGDGAGYECG